MSKTKNKESFFWTSYSDLMTSLFFIMLVLFVLIVIVMHNNAKKSREELEKYAKQMEELAKRNEEMYNELKADKDMINKVETLQKQFKALQESGEFDYLPSSQKFVAKNLQGEIFEPYKDVIKPQFVDKAVVAGRQIEKLLQNLYSQYGEFKYQMVIEGNCAKDEYGRGNDDNVEKYELSYRRALALYNLWLNKGINLRKYNTEILICGSGLNGIDRDPVWYNNKRFTIQIIPKIQPPKKKGK